MNTKIVIVMESGLIQEVIASGALEVLSIDHDIEGGAQEYIRLIPQGDSAAALCYVRFEEVTLDPPRVAKLWKPGNRETRDVTKQNP
jgi:hypothetical protein